MVRGSAQVRRACGAGGSECAEEASGTSLERKGRQVMALFVGGILDGVERDVEPLAHRCVVAVDARERQTYVRVKARGRIELYLETVERCTLPDGHEEPCRWEVQK